MSFEQLPNEIPNEAQDFDSSRATSTTEAAPQREQEQPRGPSVKQRASALWGALRTAVTVDAPNALRSAVEPIAKRDNHVRFGKPICIEGERCTQSADPDHMRAFRHYCPRGVRCPERNNARHHDCFLHEMLFTSAYARFDERDAGGGGGLPSSKVNLANTAGFSMFHDASDKRGRLVPMRASYAEQAFVVLVYLQGAQWPTEGEPVEDDMIGVAGGGAAASSGDGGAEQPRPAGFGSTVKNRVGDFFDSLFGTSGGGGGGGGAGRGYTEVDTSASAAPVRQAVGSTTPPAGSDGDGGGEEDTSLLDP